MSPRVAFNALKLKRIGKKLLLLVGSSFLTILVLEIAFRIFFPQSLTFPYQDYYLGISCNKASVQGRSYVPGCFESSIVINGQRFRDKREIGLEPKPGVFRIAVLGDSFTFGIGCNNEETYPSVLEQVLILKGRNVEVINAGCGGTGTGEQVLWYKKYVRNYHPKIVILSVICNDLEDDRNRGLFELVDGRATARNESELEALNGKTSFFRRAAANIPGYQWLSVNSHLLAFIRNQLSQFLANQKSSQLLSDADSKGNSLYASLALQESEIELLFNWTANDNAQLVVLYLPSSPETEVAIHSVEVNKERLQALCLRLNIPFYDLTAFVKIAQEKTGQTLYHSGLDTHPNSIGYKIFAEGAAEFIDEKLTPKGH